MTRNSVLARIRFRKRGGWHGAWTRGPAIMGVILAHVVGFPPGVRGAGIFGDLTPRDRSQPMVLSQVGEPIAVGPLDHLRPVLAAGTVPAYLAFPLHGGERFPVDIPTLVTGSQPGQAVGPLDLTSTDQSQLNADLIASRGAVVVAPGQSYAVSLLPRYARALAHADPSASTSGSGTSAATGLSSFLGLNAPTADWYINGISGKQLSRWFKTGSSELAHLTSLGLGGVGKTLGLKLTPTNSGLKVEAQELIPPTGSDGTAPPLPVPAPEPAAWLVFTLLVVAGGLYRRG